MQVFSVGEWGSNKKFLGLPFFRASYGCKGGRQHLFKRIVLISGF